MLSLYGVGNVQQDDLDKLFVWQFCCHFWGLPRELYSVDMDVFQLSVYNVFYAILYLFCDNTTKFVHFSAQR